MANLPRYRATCAAKRLFLPATVYLPDPSNACMLPEFLFVLLSVVAVVAALGMLISRNPVTSALWLVVVLFCISGLYLTLNAQFVAVIQILVYAGAIMVLFLFVIMLLNLAALPRLERIDWKKGVGFILAVAIFAQLGYTLAIGYDLLPASMTAEVAAENASVNAIAMSLFTEYAFALQVIGILLLVATIGAVMIAKRRFA